MFSELFYENFNLNIVSIELVQLKPLSLRDRGRERGRGRERERSKLDFYRADKSKAPVPFILGLFSDPPMVLVTFVLFAMSLTHDDAT